MIYVSSLEQLLDKCVENPGDNALSISLGFDELSSVSTARRRFKKPHQLLTKAMTARARRMATQMQKQGLLCAAGFPKDHTRREPKDRVSDL